MNKRDFIKALGAMALSSPFLSYKNYVEQSIVDLSIRKNLNDEDLWKDVRKDYLLKKEYIPFSALIPQPIIILISAFLGRLSIFFTLLVSEPSIGQVS